MAKGDSQTPLGDTGVNYGSKDGGSVTYWSGSQEGHSHTYEKGDETFSYTHSPDNAAPNGFVHNNVTGEDTKITDGKKS